ncbi:MAG: hypothetical protein SVJ22_05845 [Halobacteriota archaeon]|nr:hypothetical protein [Halobacteriota archaeon]
MMRDESAQMNTIEGVSAAVLMMITLFFVTQSSIITPQTEMLLDTQLRQLGNDALRVLDSEEITNNYNANNTLLELYVANWSSSDLESDIDMLLPDNILYNLDFIHLEKNLSVNRSRVVTRGAPVEDSVIVSRLVSLHSDDNLSNKWNLTIAQTDVKVVEVRLALWYI